MTASKGFIEFLQDQLRSVGPVAIRRMFGGAGVFADGIMFALVADDTLYFKADDTTRADFEAEDMPVFSYETKDGRKSLVSYWRAPERLFDDPEEMQAWAMRAVGAARRGASARSKATKGRKTRAG
jgi:DNA transformation protein